MKIGASTLYALLSRTPLETVREMQKNGIDVVELMCEYRHTLISEGDIVKLKGTGADFSVHFPFSVMSFAHLNPEMRKPQARMVNKYLRIAEKLGATCCVMHGGTIPDFYMQIDSPVTRDYFREIFVKEFGKVFEKANDSGVKIVMENLGFQTQLGAIYEDIIQIRKRMPYVGFCLDIPHAFMFGGSQQLNKYIDNLKIDHVHVTDSVAGQDKHWAVGKGQLPIKETLQKLKQKGYNGKVIFEGLTLKDTLESVKILREMVG